MNTYIDIDIDTCLYVCVYMCMCIHIYIYIYLYLLILRVYIICVFIHVCIYICITDVFQDFLPADSPREAVNHISLASNRPDEALLGFIGICLGLGA